MPESAPGRAVRSFVLRSGRLTSAQHRALTELAPRYCITLTNLSTELGLGGSRPPLHLEIGIGNGANLVAMATRHPDNRYLGSEVHRPGLGHALLALERHGLANAGLHAGDALDLLDALPDGVLAAVHVFFPDPWPKKRHHKRRLLESSTLELLGLKLKRGGRLYFATDDADYAGAVRAAVETCAGWLNLAGHGCWAPRPCWRALTRFEQRARRSGSRVYELALATSG